MRNLYSVSKIYIASALLVSFTVGNSVPAFRVKLGADDLNCVDVPLNPTLSLTPIFISQGSVAMCLRCGGIFDDRCIVQVLLGVSVRELRKSVNS